MHDASAAWFDDAQHADREWISAGTVTWGQANTLMHDNIRAADMPMSIRFEEAESSQKKKPHSQRPQPEWSRTCVINGGEGCIHCHLDHIPASDFACDIVHPPPLCIAGTCLKRCQIHDGLLCRVDLLDDPFCAGCFSLIPQLSYAMIVPIRCLLTCPCSKPQCCERDCLVDSV